MEKTLGTKISELRRERGLKQDEIAEKLGVSPQAVSKWENDISYPDIMTLPKLAELLGCSVDILLSDKADELPETKYLPENERKSFEELMLRIKIDTDDNTKIKVNLPMPLIKVLLESGASIEKFTGGAGGSNIDLSAIMAMVETGMMGKLVEVDSDDCHIEIEVE